MIKLGLTNYTPEVSPVVAQALAETIAWCSLRNSLSHDLRSPEIDPSGLLEPLKFSEAQGSIQAWIRDLYARYREAVSQLTHRRSDLLSALNVAADANHETAREKGRLLVYFPMETVDCGASEASSHNFFNGKDAPPWDTWFWYSEGAILTWIPEDFISRAQAGIDANPVDCIHWADWRDLPRLSR